MNVVIKLHSKITGLFQQQKKNRIWKAVLGPVTEVLKMVQIK